MPKGIEEDIPTGIRIFERKHMLAILFFVHSRGGCTRIELYNGVANNDRMPDKLGVLEEAGLITQHIDRNTRAVRIEMTDVGMEAMGHLLEVDRLIERP